jgi:hypothetical protein|tara:strand:- start:901 stop:1131 length:231 start_codon:yes stop_codon:yes gene_type:complete
MTEVIQFIEYLENIKKMILASHKEWRANIHVLKYIDILIELQNDKIRQFEKDMWEEYNAKVYASGTRPVKSKHQKK